MSGVDGFRLESSQRQLIFFDLVFEDLLDNVYGGSISRVVGSHLLLLKDRSSFS